MPTSVGLLQDLEVYAIILPVASVDEGTDALKGTTEGGVFRTADKEGQSILLAIDPQDALAVRHILDVGGELDLAVRAPGDDTIVEMVPALIACQARFTPTQIGTRRHFRHGGVYLRVRVKRPLVADQEDQVSRDDVLRRPDTESCQEDAQNDEH